MAPPPPSDLDAIWQAARALGGRSLSAIAAEQGAALPDDLSRHKGFVGQLIERALGATASSRPTPDFEALGVELKTLPIGADGRPRESTFVCTARLDQLRDADWAASRVRKKLAHVLWVPVEAAPEIPLANRRVGAAFLWRLQGDDERALRTDWQDLVAFFSCGAVDALTARDGRYLQLRPKAANAKARRRLVDDSGEEYETLPRGFYLRRIFTERLLAEAMRPTVANAGSAEVKKAFSGA